MRIFEILFLANQFTALTPRQRFNRYNVLLKMIKHYTPGFDERNVFQYGCHCLINEKQMTSLGIGKPVDELDSACRKYKNCQRVRNLKVLKIFDDKISNFKKSYTHSKSITEFIPFILFFYFVL